MTNQLTNILNVLKGYQAVGHNPCILNHTGKVEIKALSTLLVDFAIDPLDSLLCTTGHITKLLIGNNLFVNSSQDCRI